MIGSRVEMDLHMLAYLKVGSAKAYRVMFGVYNAVSGARYILVGLSFIKQFRTTFIKVEGRVLFRSRRLSNLPYAKLIAD
jgi:hypothetical protein